MNRSFQAKNELHFPESMLISKAIVIKENLKFDSKYSTKFV